MYKLKKIFDFSRWRKLIVLTLFSVIFASCSENTEQQRAEEVSKTPEIISPTVEDEAAAEPTLKPEKESMVLNTFAATAVPQDFSGCGCTLHETEEDMKADMFLFVDAGNLAIISLNGQPQKLYFKGEKNEVRTYANDSVVVEKKIIKSETTPEMEETAQAEVLLTVTKGQQKLEKKVIGICGC
ncbi:hypothetical protein WG947_04410 [Pontibacter sp. H259]|uniref:hypothetical protein n=1 Tax=Pontibacter sp. H259 TaxID=3133421 RepID=UPI0030C1F2FB